MPRRKAARNDRAKNARGRKRRSTLLRFWPAASRRRRWRRAFRRAPPGLQVVICLLVIAAVALAVNGIYQVIRKPTELFFPVSGTLNKTPPATWRQYHSAFEAYSTRNISPELLAALAQVEASGNPIARTYWRWSWSLHLFSVYRPASSAVGMYQLTDGTFAEARRYCIRDHQVIEDGPWKDWHSCWFNSLYFRVLPAHSIELTSAYLDRAVLATLDRHGLASATPRQRQELAAVIHLCGAGAGDVFARRRFRLTDGQKCGDHEVRVYVARVNEMQSVFARLAASADQ